MRLQCLRPRSPETETSQVENWGEAGWTGESLAPAPVEEGRGWSWNLIFTASILSSPDKVWQFHHPPTPSQDKLSRFFIIMQWNKNCFIFFFSQCFQFLTFGKIIPYLPRCERKSISKCLFFFRAFLYRYFLLSHPTVHSFFFCYNQMITTLFWPINLVAGAWSILFFFFSWIYRYPLFEASEPQAARLAGLLWKYRIFIQNTKFSLLKHSLLINLFNFHLCLESPLLGILTLINNDNKCFWLQWTLSLTLKFNKF